MLNRRCTELGCRSDGQLRGSVCQATKAERGTSWETLVKGLFWTTRQKSDPGKPRAVLIWVLQMWFLHWIEPLRFPPAPRIHKIFKRSSGSESLLTCFHVLLQRHQLASKKNTFLIKSLHELCLLSLLPCLCAFGSICLKFLSHLVILFFAWLPDKVVKTTDSGIRLPKSESRLRHLLAVHQLLYNLPAFSFLICKRGITPVSNS